MLFGMSLEMLREHVKPNGPDAASTINYTFQDCGPSFANVVPDVTTVQLYGRFADLETSQDAFERIQSCAKGAALALDRPLIPVHHVRGHIAANYLTHPDLEPPFVCLCVSGGTTAIVDVRSYTEMEVLGGTRDDAAGECFDKVARVLGIGYPGGAPMDRLADGGDDTKYELPRAHVQGAELDMSFSGLKTACLNLIHNAQQKGDALDLPSFAASFGRAVSESLVPRAMEASRRKGYGRLAVAGGVAANRRIRADLEAACRQSGDRLFLPELKYCGDNAAMIGCQGYYEFLAGRTAGLDLNAYATRDISLG